MLPDRDWKTEYVVKLLAGVLGCIGILGLLGAGIGFWIGSSEFTRGSFKDLPMWVERLCWPSDTDQLSVHLLEQLSGSTQSLMASHQRGREVSDELAESLLE